MVYNWVYTRKSAPLSDEDRLERAIGNGPEHVDQTTFRSKANRDLSGTIYLGIVCLTELRDGPERIRAGGAPASRPVADFRRKFIQV